MRGLIGRYHGRLVDHATSFHYRMGNLYYHAGRGLLDASGVYDGDQECLRSTVYRFPALEAHAQLFEREQIFIDARVVDSTDLDFVKFVKALQWVMTDVALFEGTGYDKLEGRDHFTSDRLRSLCEAFLDGEGQVPSFRSFEKRVVQTTSWDDDFELSLVFEFFDGLSPDPERLRWDRLVALDALTMLSCAASATSGRSQRTMQSRTRSAGSSIPRL